jgi:hypothetical protein
LTFEVKTSWKQRLIGSAVLHLVMAERSPMARRVSAGNVLSIRNNKIDPLAVVTDDLASATRSRNLGEMTYTRRSVEAASSAKRIASGMQMTTTYMDVINSRTFGIKALAVQTQKEDRSPDAPVNHGTNGLSTCFALVVPVTIRVTSETEKPIPMRCTTVGKSGHCRWPLPVLTIQTSGKPDFRKFH